MSVTSNAESVTTENKIKYVYLLLNSVKCARNIIGVFKDADFRIAFKAYSTINNDLQNCEQYNQYENIGNYQLLLHNCGDVLALARMLHLENTFCRTQIEHSLHAYAHAGHACEKNDNAMHLIQQVQRGWRRNVWKTCMFT